MNLDENYTRNAPVETVSPDGKIRVRVSSGHTLTSKGRAEVRDTIARIREVRS